MTSASNGPVASKETRRKEKDSKGTNSIHPRLLFPAPTIPSSQGTAPKTRHAHAIPFPHPPQIPTQQSNQLSHPPTQTPHSNQTSPANPATPPPLASEHPPRPPPQERALGSPCSDFPSASEVRSKGGLKSPRPAIRAHTATTHEPQTQFTQPKTQHQAPNTQHPSTHPSARKSLLRGGDDMQPPIERLASPHRIHDDHA